MRLGLVIVIVAGAISLLIGACGGNGTREVRVPKVMYKQVGEARVRVERAGLKVAITYVGAQSLLGPVPGRVVGESPKGHEQVPEGSTVYLQVEG